MSSILAMPGPSLDVTLSPCHTSSNFRAKNKLKRSSSLRNVPSTPLSAMTTTSFRINGDNLKHNPATCISQATSRGEFSKLKSRDEENTVYPPETYEQTYVSNRVVRSLSTPCIYSLDFDTSDQHGNNLNHRMCDPSTWNQDLIVDGSSHGDTLCICKGQESQQPSSFSNHLSKSQSNRSMTELAVDETAVVNPILSDNDKSVDGGSDGSGCNGVNTKEFRDLSGESEDNMSSSAQALQPNSNDPRMEETIEEIPMAPFVSGQNDGELLSGGVQRPSSIRYGGQASRHTPRQDMQQRSQSKKDGILWKPFGCFPSISIPFSRQVLMHVIDFHPRFVDRLWAALLIFATAFIAFELSSLYWDIGLVAMWISATTAQFALIKHAPTDSFTSLIGDKSTAFARALYFVLFGLLALLLDVVQDWVSSEHTLYGVSLTSSTAIRNLRGMTLVIIAIFPFLFVLGVLPVLRTALHHVAEQIDLHIFGGEGTQSLAAACVQVILSVCCAFVIFLIVRLDMNGERLDIFSLACAATIGLSTLLSRTPSNTPVLIFKLVCSRMMETLSGISDRCKSHNDKTELMNTQCGEQIIENQNQTATSNDDNFAANEISLSHSENKVVRQDTDSSVPFSILRKYYVRFGWDLALFILLSALWYLISLTGIFRSHQTTIRSITITFLGIIGLLSNFLMLQARATHPFRVLKNPLFGSIPAIGMNAPPIATKWYEQLVWWGSFINAHIVAPIFILNEMHSSAPFLRNRFGRDAGAGVLAVAALKIARSRFGDVNAFTISVIIAFLFFRYDFSFLSESTVVDLSFVLIAVSKFNEFLLKIRFIFTYNVPWNIKQVLGSEPHAVIYPFTIAHGVVMTFQAILAAILSAPVYPLLGSSIFLVSYFRPLRFWERDYKTRRIDDETMQLKSSINQSNATANNLNSLFYEEVCSRMQQCLAKDIEMGRFGLVSPGDIFLLLDGDNQLTLFLHIIELGNGYVSFQVRGLEFVGTFCQAREVEALEYDQREAERLCCLSESRSNRIWPSILLSFNAIAQLRWVTWQHVSPSYVLEGYSISRMAAQPLFASYDMRQTLLDCLNKAIIFYTVCHGELVQWLRSESILQRLYTMDTDYVDRDVLFNSVCDPDFDTIKKGVSLKSFYDKYCDWIKCCTSHVFHERMSEYFDEDKLLVKTCNLDAPVTKLCFATCILTRRIMLNHARNMLHVTDSFLHGFYGMFRGSLQPENPKDEWSIYHPKILTDVVFRGSRMSLCLRQDYFTDPEEYNNVEELWESLNEYDSSDSSFRLRVYNETDPRWRNAILDGFPSLLSLRWNVEDSSNNKQFFVISLVRQRRSYKVVKVNKESVRGLWAAQQQEVIFFRSNRSERGSIQNAKCVLRNLISQSNDQPVGYPIYVSPIVTSFSSNDSQHAVPFRISQGFRWLSAQLFKSSFINSARQSAEEGEHNGNGSPQTSHHSSEGQSQQNMAKDEAASRFDNNANDSQLP